MGSIDRLYVALHQTALDSREGISGLARQLGKRERTLHGKLNPTDETHEPTIGEFISIMKATGDTTPLDILCNIFGGKFTTKSHSSSDNITSSILRASSEHGDVMREIQISLADGNLTEKEKVKVKREIDEARQALTDLENTLNKNVVKLG